MLCIKCQCFLRFYFVLRLYGLSRSNFRQVLLQEISFLFLLLKCVLFIIRFGSFNCISSATESLWKNVYLIFVMFSESLFALNYSEKCISSLLTVSKSLNNNVNKFVSSCFPEEKVEFGRLSSSYTACDVRNRKIEQSTLGFLNIKNS